MQEFLWPLHSQEANLIGVASSQERVIGVKILVAHVILHAMTFYKIFLQQIITLRSSNVSDLSGNIVGKMICEEWNFEKKTDCRLLLFVFNL